MSNATNPTTNVNIEDLRTILDLILTTSGATTMLNTDSRREAFYRLSGALFATNQVPATVVSGALFATNQVPDTVVSEAPIFLGVQIGDSNKIKLIKVYREQTSVGLNEAKKWIEGKDLTCSVKIAEALWQAGARIKWPEGYPVSYRDIEAGGLPPMDHRDPDRW